MSERIDQLRLETGYVYRLCNPEKIGKRLADGYEIDKKYSSGSDTDIGGMVLMRKKAEAPKPVFVKSDKPKPEEKKDEVPAQVPFKDEDNKEVK